MRLPSALYVNLSRAMVCHTFSMNASVLVSVTSPRALVMRAAELQSVRSGFIGRIISKYL
jgi:hypothetical protein